MAAWVMALALLANLLVVLPAAADVPSSWFGADVCRAAPPPDAAAAPSPAHAGWAGSCDWCLSACHHGAVAPAQGAESPFLRHAVATLVPAAPAPTHRRPSHQPHTARAPPALLP
jgi:hypothetical protein